MKVRFTQKSREKLDAVYHYYKDLSQGYLVEGSYKIIYRVEGNDVLIINIFDTRQDLEKMFD